MDVFSRYLFASLTSSQDAEAIGKVIINMITKHAYLPTTIISDKRKDFVSHVIKEVAGLLGTTLKQTTKNHAQTIGLLERSHASIKQALKIRQASGDHFGTNTSISRSSIIKLLTTKVLAASQAEVFTAVFPTIPWIKN